MEDARHSWHDFLVNSFSAVDARVRARLSFRKVHTLLILGCKRKLEILAVKPGYVTDR